MERSSGFTIICYVLHSISNETAVEDAIVDWMLDRETDTWNVSQWALDKVVCNARQFGWRLYLRGKQKNKEKSKFQQVGLRKVP